MLLFIDLVQDLDLLAPIAAGLAQCRDLVLKVVVTDRCLEKSPRVQSTLSALGIDIVSVVYKAVLKHAQPNLSGVRAVITASESTAGPHRAAHALTKRANKSGIVTYTLQHGYENIGLNYSDLVYPLDKIRFASQHVLIWGKVEQLSPDVALETREKCISVGCSKDILPAQALPKIEHTGRSLIAVFENLHWERYSDEYRTKALGDIESAARKFPAVTFLVKPHPAGLWLTKQGEERLPQADNIIVIDPRVEEWQAFTAPAFIAIADAAISTPSTVALDAARLRKPVAVIGYDLPLSNYEPLPILKETQDWVTFIEQVCTEPHDNSLKQRSTAFTEQVLIDTDGAGRILDKVMLDIVR